MKDLYKDMLSIIIGILLVQLLWSSFNNYFMIIKEKIFPYKQNNIMLKHNFLN